MRTLLILAILVIPAASAETSLFFVGTGEDYVVFTEPDPSPALYKSSNFAVSAAGHGDAATTYETHPGNDIDENSLIPTFIYEGDPVTLAADDVVTVHYFASMNGGDGVGPGCGLTAHMYDGEGTIIAEQFVESGTMTPGVHEFVFGLSGVAGEFSKFKFQMVQTGSGTGGSDICGNMGITHHWGSDDAPARVVLPAAKAPVPLMATHYEDLAAPEVYHAFENATSDTYMLNFTNDVENVTASFAWNGTGSVDVQLNGPEGIVFEGAFDGDGSEEETFEGVPSGEWNVTLVYSNFTGSFDFALEDTATPGAGGAGGGGAGGAGGGGGTGGASGSDDGGADGNATGNETVDGADDKGSPGLPMVAGLGVVALMAALRRRR